MFDETELEEMAVEVIYNYYNGKYSKEYIRTIKSQLDLQKS